MSEKCGVCGRPKGDPHRYPVAGECTAPDSSDYTVSLQCLSIALRKAQDDVKAAEERGRRRGVEERDELRATIAELLPMAERAHHADLGKHLCPDVSSLPEGLRIAREGALLLRLHHPALAPRDSAPAIPSVASQGCPECSKPQPGDLGMGSIEARQLRCPHGKYAPRDSGKEGT